MLSEKIREAQETNDDLYNQMLRDIKIIDTERIINEGVMGVLQRSSS